MKRPLVIDLFCGLGGWTRGFLAAGYDAIGFDIERHDYGTGGYPAQLVLQDVLTLHGSQFRNAAAIVASPPCQEYSYMAMPWKRAKQIASGLRGKGEFPEGYTGSRTPTQLMALFDACFRLQREASEASGRYIPLVVENVKGAQPWVGRAKANFGSFYLWGDVAMVGNRVTVARPEFGQFTRPSKAQKFNPDGTQHGQGSWFKIADSANRGARAEKVPGFNFHQFEKTGKSGGSFQSAAVAAGVKIGTGDSYQRGRRPHLTNPTEQSGRKGHGGGWFSDEREDGTRPHWKESGCVTRNFNSKSPARKAASAAIAEIPFDLAFHIAQCYHPGNTEHEQAYATY